MRAVIAQHTAEELANDLKDCPRFAGMQFEVELHGVEYQLEVVLTRKGEPTLHELLAEAEGK